MKIQKNLSDLQKLVQSAVQSYSAPNDLNSEIVEKPPPIQVIERIKIYQEAYRIRLLESLRDDYSELEELMGGHDFDLVAQEYIKQVPSQYQNLAEYSEGFIAFIKAINAELELPATKCWLKILSSHARSPDNRLSFDQVQSGQHFRVEVLPSTFYKELKSNFVIAYRSNDEVRSDMISDVQYQLLQFLTTEKSLDEISSFANEFAVSDKVVSATLYEWIKNQIIYCKLI